MSLPLVVGNDDCQFIDVISTLNVNNSQELCKQLFHIAKSLRGMDLWRIKSMEIERSRSPQDFDPSEAFETILLNYRSAFADNATLENFISVLRKHNCNKEANDLCKQFGIPLPVQPVANRLLSFQGNQPIIETPENFALTTKTWADQIQNSSFQCITDFLKECTDKDLFCRLVQNSVQIAYDGDLANFTKIDNFISQIPTLIGQYYGYASLLSSMMERDHGHTKEMMKFAYRIKIAIIQLSGQQFPDIINKYYDLKNNLPKAIRAIIFGHTVTIRNIRYVEYMYESAKLVDNTSRHIVFTWKPGVAGRQAYWRFEVRWENGQLYFFIRNDTYKNGSPLSLTSQCFDESRLKIVTRPNESESNCSKWTVEPVRSANEALAFTIKNKFDGSYLYSPNEMHFYEKLFFQEKLRRYVFCWKGNPNEIVNNPKTYWDIEEKID